MLAHPELGHLRPQIWLGEALRRAGYDVAIGSIVDAAPLVRRSGLEFVPLFEDLFPAGTLARFVTARSYRERKRQIALMDSFLRQLSGGLLRHTLRRVAPHVCLVDALFFYLALSCVAERIPTAIVHTSVPPDDSRGLPPTNTTLIPHAGWRYRCARRLALTRNWLIYAGRRYGLGPLGLQLPLGSRVRELAEASGYPRDAVASGGHPFMMLTAIPHVVLCPPELEFPGAAAPNRRYIGPHVSADEDVAEFPWDALDDRRQLVYCALGSQAGLYGHRGAQLIRSLVAATARDERLQVVVAAGALYPAVADLATHGAIVVKKAPQLALLGRASVFVTHGGLGSVKESVLHGVPMVVFPMVNEQPGNAARVAFHGLGVIAGRRDLSPERIGALVETVLRDPRYREAAARIRSSIEDRCAREPCGHIVEDLMRSGTPRASGVV